MPHPLCTSPKIDLHKVFETAKLASDWQANFGLDILNEFHGSSHIKLHRCRVCGLRFFKRDEVAGPPAIYDGLSKIDWYYLPRKWEHAAVFEDLAGCENGIEIGCGFGSFVQSVIGERKIAFEGCEQSARPNGPLKRLFEGGHDKNSSFAEHFKSDGDN